MIGQTSGADSQMMILSGANKIIISLILCSGILYVLNGYRKDAAGYYKAFMLLFAVGTVFSLVITVLPSGIPSTPSIGGSTMIVKIIILIIFTFEKNLGKRSTWILFGVLVLMDIIFVFTYSGGDATVSQRIIGALIRLALDGTVGLAIYGKYADKDARGTI